MVIVGGFCRRGQWRRLVGERGWMARMVEGARSRPKCQDASEEEEEEVVGFLLCNICYFIFFSKLPQDRGFNSSGALNIFIGRYQIKINSLEEARNALTQAPPFLPYSRCLSTLQNGFVTWAGMLIFI